MPPLRGWEAVISFYLFGRKPGLTQSLKPRFFLDQLDAALKRRSSTLRLAFPEAGVLRQDEVGGVDVFYCEA
jgi:hypothetical protein